MVLATNSDSEEHLHSTFASRYVRAVVPRFFSLHFSEFFPHFYSVCSYVFVCIY